MKRLFVLLSCAVSLHAVAGAPAVLVQGQRPVAAELPFRAGVSTVTVEKMAEKLGCTGGQGAGLTTPQGPVEDYRMECESGQIYTAHCELRQCRTTSATPMGGYAAMTAKATIVQRQALSSTEVPALALDWRCGACVQDPGFAGKLQWAYAAEAAKFGMSVSDSAKATVAVMEFTKKVFPLRNSIAVQGIYGRHAVDVRDSTTAFSGTDYLATVAAKRLFQGLRGKAVY